MGLANHQYETILREYGSLRMKNELRADEKARSIYEAHPALKSNRDALSESALLLAKAKISGADTSSIEEKRNGLKRERKTLLAAAGLSESDFLPKYDCPYCKDTGFMNGRKCRCFVAKETRMLYENSHLDAVLSKENFETLRTDLYSRIAPAGKKSVFQEMSAQIEVCKAYAEDFGKEPRNLLFYGAPGTGKTFLTNCIAKDVMDRGFSVIYFSAISLFEEISEVRFRRDEEASPARDLSSLYVCDLLIIDDLGTELTNAFVQSELFHLVNERILNQKSTIISTNLNQSSLADHYTERTASRIVTHYDAIRLVGDDLRVRIKLEEARKKK